MITNLEKKIIAAIQEDIPITKRPYLEMADKLGISEELFLETLNSLCAKGIIRRFGATLRHQNSGFSANAMAAWKVDEDKIDEVGKKMASFRHISHCYNRSYSLDWNYNLYTMIHGDTEEKCHEIAKNISKETGVDNYILLFSRRELKKSSMQYFPTDDES